MSQIMLNVIPAEINIRSVNDVTNGVVPSLLLRGNSAGFGKNIQLSSVIKSKRATIFNFYLYTVFVLSMKYFCDFFAERFIGTLTSTYIWIHIVVSWSCTLVMGPRTLQQWLMYKEIVIQFGLFLIFTYYCDTVTFNNSYTSPKLTYNVSISVSTMTFAGVVKASQQVNP